MAASALRCPDDLLADYLTQPSLHGTAGGDQLVGTSGADWLVGAAGDDHLIGGAGRRARGRAGQRSSRGRRGRRPLSVQVRRRRTRHHIHDTEGSNVAVLDGFSGSQVRVSRSATISRSSPTTRSSSPSRTTSATSRRSRACRPMTSSSRPRICTPEPMADARVPTALQVETGCYMCSAGALCGAQIAVEPSGRGRGASTYCARRSPSSRPRRQRTS